MLAFISLVFSLVSFSSSALLNDFCSSKITSIKIDELLPPNNDPELPSIAPIVWMSSIVNKRSMTSFEMLHNSSVVAPASASIVREICVLSILGIKAVPIVRMRATEKTNNPAVTKMTIALYFNPIRNA